MPQQFALITLFQHSEPSIPTFISASSQDEAKRLAIEYLQNEDENFLNPKPDSFDISTLSATYQEYWYVLPLPVPVTKCFVETRIPGFGWTREQCNDFRTNSFVPYDSPTEAESAIAQFKLRDDPMWATAHYRIVPAR